MGLEWRIGLSLRDFCLSGKGIDLRIEVRYWTMGLLLHELLMCRLLLASWVGSMRSRFRFDTGLLCIAQLIQGKTHSVL